MSTHTASVGPLCRVLALAGLLASFLLVTAAGAAPADSPVLAKPVVRAWTIHYTAHNGADREAVVLLPAGYGPDDNPEIPVVISPHGRGATGRSNADFWGNLPAVGRFAVINPDGMGRSLKRFSYGYAGQIDDLARMPELAEQALPWLRLDRSRVYALGSSMGGQETLLLVARHPELLAGAAAMDSVTDLARRYHQLPHLPCDRQCFERWGRPSGVVLQSAMRREVGAHAPAEPAGLCLTERAQPGTAHRRLGRPAPDLVEHAGSDRLRPAPPVEGPPRPAPRARAVCARGRVRGPLAPFDGDAGSGAAADRAGRLRALAGRRQDAPAERPSPPVRALRVSDQPPVTRSAARRPAAPGRRAAPAAA